MPARFLAALSYGSVSEQLFWENINTYCEYALVASVDDIHMSGMGQQLPLKLLRTFLLGVVEKTPLVILRHLLPAFDADWVFLK